jgi:hypothetical protein
MNKTVAQVTKETIKNWARGPRWTWTGLKSFRTVEAPVYSVAKSFYKRDVWKQHEEAGKANLLKDRLLVLWADAHTISVQDEVITITRDENNFTQTHEYKANSFNTVMIKNLDEARKIENNRGLFGGLYVVDCSSKNIYRLVKKINNKVRLERILNGYITNLPWLSGPIRSTWIWDGTPSADSFGKLLNTTNNNPSANGY